MLGRRRPSWKKGRKCVRSLAWCRSAAHAWADLIGGMALVMRYLEGLEDRSTYSHDGNLPTPRTSIAQHAEKKHGTDGAGTAGAGAGSGAGSGAGAGSEQPPCKRKSPALDVTEDGRTGARDEAGTTKRPRGTELVGSQVIPVKPAYPRRCEFFHWSAVRLPLRAHTVDVALVDLPFGMRHLTRKQCKKLYPEYAAVVERCLHIRPLVQPPDCWCTLQVSHRAHTCPTPTTRPCRASYFLAEVATTQRKRHLAVR